MSSPSAKLLPLLVVSGLVLTGAALTARSVISASGISFQAPVLEEVHFRDRAIVELNNPNPLKLYIAESGSHVIITRAILDPEQTKIVRIVARSGSEVEAFGTKINVTADAGSIAAVSDGVNLDATGAKMDC